MHKAKMSQNYIRIVRSNLAIINITEFMLCDIVFITVAGICSNIQTDNVRHFANNRFLDIKKAAFNAICQEYIKR